MAKLVAEGIKSAGKTADLISADDADAAQVLGYSAIAFGCSSQGDEALEEDSMEPLFASVEGSLSGKTVALFGSYGWGDGQWMRDWVDRTNATGANLVGNVIANEYPDDDAAEECKALGAKLAA